MKRIKSELMYYESGIFNIECKKVTSFLRSNHKSKLRNAKWPLDQNYLKAACVHIREKGKRGCWRVREKRNWETGREIEGPDLQIASATCTTEYNGPIKLYWRMVIMKSDIFIHKQYRFNNHHHFVKKIH